MEYFLAVVENKGINGAAAALGVAQRPCHKRCAGSNVNWE